MGESLLARKTREVGGPAALVAAVGIDRVLELTRTWRAIARPEQLVPGSIGASQARADWRNWLLMAGRGFGKSRTGAEAVSERVIEGRARSVALIAPTYKAARRLMIENPFSGILAISPPQHRPIWNKADGELRWPNGAIGYIYTSEEPDGVRGFNGDLAWCEEICAWKYPNETWSNLQLGLRVPGPKGDRAQSLITTTPRPTPLIKQLLDNPRTVVTGGTTYDNAQNLDPDALQEFIDLYAGTRLGEQELLAKLLGDTPGALWTSALIEKLRVRVPPELLRIVVAIDPPTKDTSRETADGDSGDEPASAECGIVAAGVGMCSCKGKPELHGFVLEDASGFMSPMEWAQAAVAVLDRLQGDRIVAEENQGGALVESNLRTLGKASIPYRGVHASKGKQTRAEPVAALYEQGKIHHVGVHAKLEDQMATWQPLRSKRSPDRMDALVWAMTDLMLGEKSAPGWSPPRTPHQGRRV